MDKNPKNEIRSLLIEVESFYKFRLIEDNF